MSAKGTPDWYRRRREGPPVDLAAEREVRRLAARAAGMFDEFTERPAFEAWFAYSRASSAARERMFAQLGDGSYADDHTQRHWWTWQCSAGGGRPLPPYNMVEAALRRLDTQGSAA